MKYELEQLVFYLNDNKVHSANVLSRMTVENAQEQPKQNTEYNKQQVEFYMKFGPSGTFYRTVHGVWEEKDVFESKFALAQSLMDEATTDRIKGDD